MNSTVSTWIRRSLAAALLLGLLICTGATAAEPEAERSPADAARDLEKIHAQQPDNEPLYFKLGQVYVQLKRYSQAEKVFRSLEHSKNPDMATAASAALRTLRSEMARESKYQTEERVYDLASQFKYAQVLEELTKLEQAGPLSFAMEMQRLYAWQALSQFAPALKRVDALAITHPQATDLALVRADLLAQLGRRGEAEQIWKQIEREKAGTPAALVATERLKGTGRPEENLIYDLAQQHKYPQVLEAITALEEKESKLSWAMEMQRLYAWQSLGQTDRALQQITALSKTHPGSNELALIQADLLIRQHEWQEASKILKQVKDQNPDSPVAKQAESRLESIPVIANLDKWYWGEAYLSGDYLGRFGAVVGSGFVRHGWFIPEARWLQPYLEMRFTTDTRSTVGRERSLIADNFIGFSGGVRAQPFPTEYLFFYISGGINKDLLDQRDGGDWAGDYQGGLYGFKSWGPGTVLISSTPGQAITATGNLPATSVENRQNTEFQNGKTNLFFWRGDWFVDAGADFSYYNRFSSWIGYGQAHEGFRLFQIGPRAAVDAYAVENLSWDFRGNYFDNLAEVGPGARILWVPRRQWEVVLRAEYVNGFYFGRDERHNRGGASGQYDDARVALSLGVRW